MPSMSATLTQRQLGDKHEFLAGGEVVARLVWVAESADGGGWWLQAPGWPSRQLYRVPHALAHDPDLARRNGEPASVGIARAIVSDRLSGLVPGPEAHAGS